MNIFKKCAVKALSLTVALITALSVGVSASAAVKAPEIMSNDWSFLVVFFKSVDVKVELNGKTVNLKKTIDNEQIDKIKQNIIDRMPYQFMQDTHGKVGIDVIDYAYVDEPLKNKDIELGICPADYYTPGSGKGYRADVEGSKLVSGVLDECLEQNFYSQIMIFTPLGEISPDVGGWGGTQYSGVHVAQIIMYDNSDFSYYSTILHEICHGLETDSKAMNNNKTAPLHDMYWGNNAAIPQYDWYEYYMNDIRPDGKKGVEPMAFYRLRSEKHTPLAGNMTVTAPSSFSAAAKSDTAAVLSWVGITGNGYQVGIFKDADHKKLKTTIDKKANETSATLTDLKKGNTYYYGVRETVTANGKTYHSDWTYLTYTHKGKGDYSGEQVLTSQIVPPKTTLTAKKSGEKITLKWDTAKGAEKYVIYYREKGSGKYKTLATVSGSKTSYSTSKLDKSKTYQFKIRSYAESDGKKYYSSYSKAVTAK